MLKTRIAVYTYSERSTSAKCRCCNIHNIIIYIYIYRCGARDISLYHDVVTSGAGTAYSSGTPPVLAGFVLLDL